VANPKAIRAGLALLKSVLDLDLSKGSKNVRRQREAYKQRTTPTGEFVGEAEHDATETERLSRYLHGIGLTPHITTTEETEGVNEEGEPKQRTKAMGSHGPNVIDTTPGQGPHWQQLRHEASHAQQTPVGMTIKEYQEGIGQPGDRMAARENKMGGYEEVKAHYGEAGVARRAGLRPFKQPGAPNPGTLQHGAKEYARQNQRALDLGINRFEPSTGEKVVPNTPDTRINLRAAGMPREALRLLRERMEQHRSGQVKKSELAKTLKRPRKPSEDLEWHEMDIGGQDDPGQGVLVRHVAFGRANKRFEIDQDYPSKEPAFSLWHSKSGRHPDLTIHSHHDTLESAKEAAHEEHIKHHYQLSDADVKAIESAWPEGVKRLHGMHPDMVRHELDRAHENLDKSEPKGSPNLQWRPVTHDDYGDERYPTGGEAFGETWEWAHAGHGVYHRSTDDDSGKVSVSYIPGHPNVEPDGSARHHPLRIRPYKNLDAANRATLKHHVAKHYGLKNHEVKAVDAAWPEGARRLHGQHPDMVRAEVNRAVQAVGGDFSKGELVEKSAADDFNSDANNQVTRALLAAGIPVRVHGSPKTAEALKDKIRQKRRSGRTYYGPSDVTDAYRGRISVLSNNLKDIDRAAQVVRSKFEVDDANSPDYAHDPNSAYGRTHLILMMNGLPYELQIGTADAEEYGEPVHDSIYKNPKCDPALRQEHEAIMGAIKGLNANGKSYHSDPELESRIKALHAKAGAFAKSMAKADSEQPAHPLKWERSDRASAFEAEAPHGLYRYWPAGSSNRQHGNLLYHPRVAPASFGEGKMVHNSGGWGTFANAKDWATEHHVQHTHGLSDEDVMTARHAGPEGLHRFVGQHPGMVHRDMERARQAFPQDLVDKSEAAGAAKDARLRRDSAINRRVVDKANRGLQLDKNLEGLNPEGDGTGSTEEGEGAGMGPVAGDATGDGGSLTSMGKTGEVKRRNKEAKRSWEVSIGEDNPEGDEYDNLNVDEARMADARVQRNDRRVRYPNSPGNRPLRDFDPLNESFGLYPDRLKGSPKPKLPKGHDRRHPKYIGTNTGGIPGEGLGKAEKPENSKETNTKKDADQRKPFEKPSMKDGGEDQSIMDANVEGAMQAMGFGHVTGRISPNAMALRHLAYKLKVYQNRQNKEAFTRKPLGKDDPKPEPQKKTIVKSKLKKESGTMSPPAGDVGDPA